MNSLIKDVRYALRSLLKHPTFTAIAVITLALGIGANTAIFSVLNAVMLRALPVKNPQQLVFLSNPDRHGVNGGQETGNRFLFAYHEFEWLRDHNQVFSEIFAVQSALSSQPIVVEGSDQNEAEPARITAVSGGYFTGLGVSTIQGRPFTAEMDQISNATPVAVISYDYWKNRFALDPSILGRRIHVRETSFETIGIRRTGFSGATVGSAAARGVPLMMEPEGCKHMLVPP